MSLSNTTSQKGQNLYAVAFKINIHTISENISILKAIKALMTLHPLGLPNFAKVKCKNCLNWKNKGPFIY